MRESGTLDISCRQEATPTYAIVGKTEDLQGQEENVLNYSRTTDRLTTTTNYTRAVYKSGIQERYTRLYGSDNMNICVSTRLD